MKVEYLIIIDSNNPFCRDKKSFDNFLQSNADISIKGNVFKHKLLEVEYELQGGENEADKNRFFHIKLTSKDDSKIDEFQDLLKATRTLLHMAFDKRPQILWDDISFYYSEKAYPIIHEIENLMRKLITKFMLTNVGLGWTRDTVPEELKKSTRTEPANNNNYLYETDFKDLSTFLFDEYRTLDIKALNEKIRLLEEQGGDVSLSEFKGFLPKSNWERYFREHVNCDSSYLQVRWDRLYKLRCKIAHNNFFSKDDFEQVMILVQDVKPKIEDAIKNLDKVEVPEDEREELAEVVASKTSTLYGEYIQKWKHIEKAIIAIVKEVSPTEDIPKHRPLMVHLKELINIGLFDKSLYDELKEANHIRNIIVHESERHLSNDELLYRINNLNIIADYISRFGVLVENDS
ncbi:hypothetical protein G6364_17395 [Vibrio cholerae]|uniref:HEPN domain-containing protein n=1 Tax=Vibrio TaxID=662 RepID=UPI000E0A1BC9|nr:MULTISPECIES: HEPN domain-containing protein [Vibrio]HBH7895009.1 hypothetical protein [Vibrio vulnificus]ELH0879398.1 hypothetical protein [Vibrio cholerae]MBE4594314.1 hypothetical protein [Vibrio navarrensis]HAS3627342.1 hypothetical protein [Vibrio cholerae]HBC2130223.1 hypothetical protein [Vibrio cholerae]